MDQKTYHGEIDPQELADVLVSRFDQGDLAARKTGRPDRVVVQISTRAHRRRDDPHTSLAVTIAKAEDGVTVTVGEQKVVGVRPRAVNCWVKEASSPSLFWRIGLVMVGAGWRAWGRRLTGLSGKERVALSYARLREVASRLGVPVHP